MGIDATFTVKRDHYVIRVQHGYITALSSRHHCKLWDVEPREYNGDHVASVIRYLQGQETSSYLDKFLERLEGLAFISDHVLDLQGSKQAKRLKTDVKDDDGICQGMLMEHMLGLLVELTE